MLISVDRCSLQTCLSLIELHLISSFFEEICIPRKEKKLSILIGNFLFKRCSIWKARWHINLDLDSKQFFFLSLAIEQLPNATENTHKQAWERSIDPIQRSHPAEWAQCLTIAQTIHFALPNQIAGHRKPTICASCCCCCCEQALIDLVGANFAQWNFSI